MLNKKAKTIEALHTEIASLHLTLGNLYAKIDALEAKNKCVGSKCSKKKQTNKKTVKTQTVANGNVKGRSGAKDVAGGKKGSKKTVKKS